jgi:hypothetical protein
MMMRPIEENGVRKIKLAEGMVFSVDVLPPELRRQWDVLCANIERGADVRVALKSLTNEILTALGPTVVMRLAHASRRSILDLGLAEDAGPVSAARGR